MRVRNPAGRSAFASHGFPPQGAPLRCQNRPVGLDLQEDVALVCADTVDGPLLMDLTSDFVYRRLPGSRVLYKLKAPRDARVPMQALEAS